MMNLFFDLDGVIRALDVAVFGRTALGWWERLADGRHLLDVVNDNTDLLLTAPRTEYFDVVLGAGIPTIITHQPIAWRDKTEEWIIENIGECCVTMVDDPSEKMRILEKYPDSYLVEDSPNLMNYDRIILIDRPYNQHIDAFMRIKAPSQLAWLMEACKW